MELAGRVYDVVTQPDNIYYDGIDVVPAHGEYEHKYWRRVLRLAALCHDIGHLPFYMLLRKSYCPGLESRAVHC